MPSPEEITPEVERRPTPPTFWPCEVFLIRHAQSEANAGFCDDCDCDLTETGRRQAQRVGKQLRAHFDLSGVIALTSPYRRTRETAELIGREAALAFNIDEGCREWGKDCVVQDKHYPEEKLFRVAIRLELFLKRLPMGRRFVIVSHATPIFLMTQLLTLGNVSAALSKCVGQFWLPITTCGVTHVQDGKVICLAKAIG